MKNVFFIFNKKMIIISVLLILVIITTLIFFSVRAVSSPAQTFSIVIDAGHGGIDGGCVGKTTGVVESSLNLQYATRLKEYCENFGIKVVMTRDDMEGLYSPFATNKKKSEMEKREKIIQESNSDLFVSIHMNSIPRKSVKGSQIFYKKDSENGEQFAKDITTCLRDNNICVRGNSKEGDYYVLNCNTKAAVLIECGFLSNPEEEALLAKEEYIDSFCSAVFLGIIKFLKM